MEIRLQTSDADLTAAIRAGDERRDAALRHFYRDAELRRAVTGIVLRSGGSEQDGKELFQDAVILFDRNIRDGRFEQRSSLRTYFLAIAKWQWQNTRRSKVRHATEEINPVQVDGEDETSNPLRTMMAKDRLDMIRQVLAHTGERCKQILLLWGKGYRMEEIAADIGLSSDLMAKKEKYRCFERLKSFLDTRPDLLGTLKTLL